MTFTSKRQLLISMKQQNQIQAQQSEYFYCIIGHCVHVIVYRELMLMAAINSKVSAATSFVPSTFERQSGMPTLRCDFYLVVAIC